MNQTIQHEFRHEPRFFCICFEFLIGVTHSFHCWEMRNSWNQFEESTSKPNHFPRLVQLPNTHTGIQHPFIWILCKTKNTEARDMPTQSIQSHRLCSPFLASLPLKRELVKPLGLCKSSLLNSHASLEKLKRNELLFPRHQGYFAFLPWN